MLDTILAGFHALGDHSTWVLADAANTLVRAAQARVYRKKPDVAEGQRLTAASVEPVLEENPKYAVLTEVLQEIRERQQAAAAAVKAEAGADDVPPAHDGGALGGAAPVLVVVEEDRTCRQLRDSLALGGQAYLQRQLRSYFRWKETLPRLTANLAQTRVTSAKGAAASPASPAMAAAPATAGSASAPVGCGAGRGGTPTPGGAPPRRRRGALIAAGRLAGSAAAPAGPTVLSAESEALADLCVQRQTDGGVGERRR